MVFLLVILQEESVGAAGSGEHPESYGTSATLRCHCELSEDIGFYSFLSSYLVLDIGVQVLRCEGV